MPPKLFVKFPAASPRRVLPPGLRPGVPERSVVQMPGVKEGKPWLLGKAHQTAPPKSRGGVPAVAYGEQQIPAAHRKQA